MDGVDNARLEMAAGIKRLRLKKGWSPGELGTRAGMTRQAVAMLEAGFYDPSVPAVRRLAKALGVSPARIIR